jgi:hypothetical protein
MCNVSCGFSEVSLFVCIRLVFQCSFVVLPFHAGSFSFGNSSHVLKKLTGIGDTYCCLDPLILSKYTKRNWIFKSVLTGSVILKV